MLPDFRFLAVPAIVATMTAACFAQEERLKPGMNAPELKVGKWVQGDVPSLSDPRKTYVVEFWATWCGPCKVSIPHLNKLYQRGRFAGLEIIGISDEPFATVKNFVAKRGSGMSYPIAVDTEDKSMGSAWMKAAQQNGIPCAFIVRGGKILWIGNPLDKRFDLVLSIAMTGRYNPELMGKANPILQAADDAMKLRNFRDGIRHMDSVIALDAQVFGAVAVQKYVETLSVVKDGKAARAWGDEMLAKYSSDVFTLTELCATILYSDEIKDRDYELANKAVEAIGKAVPSTDLGYLRLRAALLAAEGKFDEAQEFQMQAWMAAPTELKGDYKKFLDEYRKSAKSKSTSMKKQAPASTTETDGDLAAPADGAAPTP
jgi:thiol-disulfide isomerase/thioredoxin